MPNTNLLFQNKSQVFSNTNLLLPGKTETILRY